jgi:hypothetical protein
VIAQPGGDSFELRDPRLDDPLIEALTETPAPDVLRAPAWRRLVAWSPTSAPVALLLLSGIALGPRGLNLLSLDAMSLLAPVLPVALAGLGVLVGLSLKAGRSDDGRLMFAATLEAGLTLLIVAGGLAMIALADSPSFVAPLWLVAVGAGICAASSLTLPTATPLEPRTAPTRLIELGVLVPIIAGSVVMAWLRNQELVGGATVLASAAGLICALAIATWLLLTQAPSQTEERVLTVAALLLVGGVADALSQSALLAGVLAGSCWRFAGGRPAESISRDVLFLQHPLLVLVLLTAGARADLSVPAMVGGAAYVALRTVGRLVGGRLAGRVGGRTLPGDLGIQLLPPGVFGVAFALNLTSVAGSDTSFLLSAVIVGTIGAELLAALVPARRVVA